MKHHLTELDRFHRKQATVINFQPRKEIAERNKRGLPPVETYSELERLADHLARETEDQPLVYEAMFLGTSDLEGGM